MIKKHRKFIPIPKIIISNTFYSMAGYNYDEQAILINRSMIPILWTQKELLRHEILHHIQAHYGFSREYCVEPFLLTLSREFHAYWVMLRDRPLLNRLQLLPQIIKCSIQSTCLYYNACKHYYGRVHPKS